MAVGVGSKGGAMVGQSVSPVLLCVFAFYSPPLSLVSLSSHSPVPPHPSVHTPLQREICSPIPHTHAEQLATTLPSFCSYVAWLCLHLRFLLLLPSATLMIRIVGGPQTLPFNTPS